MSGLQFVPFDAASWRRPWPLYQYLRDEEPVHWSTSVGCYVLSRFEDVFGAARDTDTFSSAQGLTFQNEIEQLGLAPTIVMMDPPDHTRFRRLVSKGFRPRQVQEIEPAVREFATERIAEMRTLGTANFIEGLARPLACFVVANYLGVPEQDRSQFAGWTEAIVQAGSGGHHMSAADALTSLYGYFSELVEVRRTEPGDDMISTLIAADDGPLRLDEILGYAFVMIAGGNDTTIGLLGGAAELLSENRGERQRLLAEPALIPNAVEECLRLTSPVQGLCRVTTQHTAVRGVEFAPGTRVLLCYGAANRDPREFGNDAEDMNVTRSIPRLLSFSSGPHFCLGAAAARLQGRVVIDELLSKCPDFDVDAEAGVFAEGAFTRRYQSLPFTAH
jgi:cytochrome P450 family 130